MADSAGSSGPAALLVAATPEAARALGEKNQVRMTAFPFRVGRESRAPKTIKQIVGEVQRRLGILAPTNHLYLMEPPSPGLLISREHFTVEYRDGAYSLIDRKSALGTIVSGNVVGGDRKGGRIALKDGDVITLGTSSSPYVFTFQLA
jgi:pSer/pThr/pTyr-binding forkhead associated (FHA) protein